MGGVDMLDQSEAGNELPGRALNSGVAFLIQLFTDPLVYGLFREMFVLLVGFPEAIAMFIANFKSDIPWTKV